MAEHGRNGTAPETERDVFLEVGTTGLKRSNGYIVEEFLRELQGLRGVRIYREMSQNDAVVGAILFAIEMLLRQVSWRVDPADQSQLAAAHADLVRGMLFKDMSQSWAMVLSDILSFLVYGWSYHELVYKRRLGSQPPADRARDPAWAPSRYNDGLIGWRKWPVRSQDTLLRWDFDTTGGVKGLWQQDPVRPMTVLIPMEKALLFRGFGARGNPEGRSILRTAYAAWYYKTHISRIEGIGIERDLAGLPVAKVPAQLLSANASTGEKAQLTEIKKIVTTIRRDEQEGIVWPLVYDQQGNELYKLELLSTGGTRQFDVDKVVQRYDVRITQAVLADTLMLGHAIIGNRSLGEEKDGLFSMALSGLLDALVDVINRHAIPRVWTLNALPQETMPSLSHGKVRRVDFDKFTQGVLRLSQAGIVFSAADEAHIRAETNFPDEVAEAIGL